MLAVFAATLLMGLTCAALLPGRDRRPIPAESPAAGRVPALDGTNDSAGDGVTSVAALRISGPTVTGASRTSGPRFSGTYFAGTFGVEAHSSGGYPRSVRQSADFRKLGYLGSDVAPLFVGVAP